MTTPPIYLAAEPAGRPPLEVAPIIGHEDRRPSQGFGRADNFFWLRNASWQSGVALIDQALIEAVRVQGIIGGQDWVRLQVVAGTKSVQLFGEFDHTFTVGQVIDRIEFFETGTASSEFHIYPMKRVL